VYIKDQKEKKIENRKAHRFWAVGGFYILILYLKGNPE
jgi:hypothetical protein